MVLGWERCLGMGKDGKDEIKKTWDDGGNGIFFEGYDAMIP